MMQAYEFYAVPKDGIIVIPEAYKYKITSGVKVILLDDQTQSFNRDETRGRHKSDLLLPPTASTKGYKWSREEANER